MKLKFAKPEKKDIPEADIQKEFEKNLGHLDDSGLKYVASYVPIGTGIIDTLALDDDLNPVIVEYKRPGAFDRDALFQLMNYYSWFASDENHVSYIREYVRKVKPELLTGSMTSDLRLIAVVSDVEEEVKNACYALEPAIQVVQYRFSKMEEDGSLIMIPQIVLDTREYEREITPPKTIEDHFRNRDTAKAVFEKLLDELRKSCAPEIKTAPTKFYINIYTREGGRGFLGVIPTRSHLRLDFKGNIHEGRFRPWTSNTAWGRSGEGGTVFLTSIDQLDTQLIDWLKDAYLTAKGQE